MFTYTVLEYSIDALCYGDLIVLDLQIWVFHMLQQFLDEEDNKVE